MLRQAVIRVKPSNFASPEVGCKYYQLQLNADDKVNITEEQAAVLDRF